MQQIRRILWIELLGGIGDLVIALPAIHAVARSHPAAELTVLTFAPAHELLTADPLVDRVIAAPKGRARTSVDQLLAAETFDLIISDTNYDGIADAIEQFQSLQPTPIRTITNLWRDPPDHTLVGQRFLQILQSEGVIQPELAADTTIHLTATEKIAAQQALGATYRPLVLLCHEAGMTIKRWPIANFVQLGQALQQNYGATVLIPVGESLAAAVALATAIGGTAQVWQRGSLRQLAAVIATADLVVAADTGLAHIADALQVPTITLFGPSWSGRYGHPAPQINLQGFPECPERVIRNFTEQSCWYSGTCPLEWQTCLETISVESVLASAELLLKTSQSSLSKPFTQPLIPKTRAYSPVLNPAWQSVRNLLVMRLDNIGDVIMTSPALQALKQNLPQAKMTLMASPAGTLAAPLLPWVDQVLSWRVLWQDLGKLSFEPDREWQLIETLKAQRFDAAIIFTSFSQSPYPAATISALADIPVRLGASKEQDPILTDAVAAPPDSLHQVERNLHLIESVGFQVSDRRLTLQVSQQSYQTALALLSSSNRQTESEPYLLLNPWTSCQSRNYAPERFAEATRKLSQITGWRVVVTGVEKDRQQAAPLLEVLGERAIDLIGRTSLSELTALVAQAELVLTNNTSVMHIADATETPAVILFAGTELACQWQPRYTKHRLLQRLTVCSPCYAFQCPHDLQCLDISPEAVVTAALELLETSQRQHRRQTDTILKS